MDCKGVYRFSFTKSAWRSFTSRLIDLYRYIPLLIFCHSSQFHPEVDWWKTLLSLCLLLSGDPSSSAWLVCLSISKKVFFDCFCHLHTRLHVTAAFGHNLDCWRIITYEVFFSLLNLRLAQIERSNGSLPTDSSSATGSM